MTLSTSRITTSDPLRIPAHYYHPGEGGRAGAIIKSLRDCSKERNKGGLTQYALHAERAALKALLFEMTVTVNGVRKELGHPLPGVCPLLDESGLPTMVFMQLAWNVGRYDYLWGKEGRCVVFVKEIFKAISSKYGPRPNSPEEEKRSKYLKSYFTQCYTCRKLTLLSGA
jgi:hypothetical protein